MDQRQSENSWRTQLQGRPIHIQGFYLKKQHQVLKEPERFLMVLGEVVMGKVTSMQCVRAVPIPKPALWRKIRLYQSPIHLEEGHFPNMTPPIAFQSYLNRGEEKLRHTSQGHSPGIQNIMGLTLPHTVPSYLQSFSVVMEGNSGRR